MSTTTHPVDSSITQGAGIPDADLDKLIAATIPVDPRDYDLMAPVPLPDGAESASTWQLTDNGRPYRVTDTGVVQYADGTVADNLSDRDATIPTMNTTAEEVPLPTGATSAEDYDPEDNTRSVRADINTGTLATQVWALQDRDGQLSEVDILLGGVCEQGYSAAQIRELVPALLRAADLADQWTGQPASTLNSARVHARAAAAAMDALRPHLNERGQFVADIAEVAAQGIEGIR